MRTRTWLLLCLVRMDVVAGQGGMSSAGGLNRAARRPSGSGPLLRWRVEWSARVFLLRGGLLKGQVVWSGARPRAMLSLAPVSLRLRTRLRRSVKLSVADEAAACATSHLLSCSCSTASLMHRHRPHAPAVVSAALCLVGGGDLLGSGQPRRR